MLSNDLSNSSPLETPPSPYDVYRELMKNLNVSPDAVSVNITGSDPLVLSIHRLGTASSAALAALGATLSLLHQSRLHDSSPNAQPCPVSVSVSEAITQLTAVFLTTLNGVALVRLFDDPALYRDSDFYQAADGRWIFLLTTYPHLRQIVCETLNCPPGKKHYGPRVAEWPDAFTLETEICQKGGCAIVARSREEWEATEQGQICKMQDLIVLEKLGDSVPEPLKPLATSRDLPLSGLKVLDNTHVIAGPMAARMAAEQGANVLHISSPEHPDPAAMYNETGIGKRNAFCDLEDEADVARFWEVIEQADVYICSYLSLDRKGFGPEALAARRPGLVCLDYHGWGMWGPWRERGGFDQLGCAATGFSIGEGTSVPDSNGKPKLPPTHLLNDYLAAMLGLAGICAALMRREEEGGSWRVHVNLAKVCTWVQDLGMFSPEEIQDLPAVKHDRQNPSLREVKGPCGTARYLPTQVHFDGFEPGFKMGAEPLGASPLSW